MCIKKKKKEKIMLGNNKNFGINFATNNVDTKLGDNNGWK